MLELLDEEADPEADTSELFEVELEVVVDLEEVEDAEAEASLLELFEEVDVEDY